MSSTRNGGAAVPSIVVSLDAAAGRAVAGTSLGRSGRGGLNVETLEGRLLMAGQPAADSSMAYDAAGTLHVAYYDAAAKHLKYTRQSTGGAWTDPAVVDATSGDVGRSASLAVDKFGRPGVAYYDAANGDLRYAYLENGTAWRTVAVDTKGSVGQNPSLAFDAKGVASISYYRQDSGDLRLATLKSLAKNRWGVSTITKKGDVGQFSSLAIDPATNRPTVAFADADGRVQVLSRTGSGFGKAAVIEDLAGAATNVDVAFGANGRPAVSYFAPAAGAIKLAETGDPRAKSFTTRAVADVPAGSNPNPTLLIDPVTKVPQVVYFDAGADGVFVASKAAGTAGAVETKRLRAGGGEGFVAAVQPGNRSISFAVVDTTGDGGVGPVDLGNTETTPVAPTGEATTYQYRVAATGGAGESKAVDWVATVTTRPKAPADLTATAASNALTADDTAAVTVHLTWADNSTAESNVKVQRLDAGTWTTIATLGAGSTGHDDTVAPGGTYSYRVRATNSGGVVVSGYATSGSVSTVPTAPGPVTATAVAGDQVSLSWADAQGETAYTVERSADGGETWLLRAANVAAGATGYADTGTAEDRTYVYRVKATNAAGESAYVTSAAVTTLPATPAGLTATAAGPDTVDLPWTDRSGIETGYKVERRVEGAADNTWAQLGNVLPAGTGAFTDSTGDESVGYEYRVRAVSGGRHGAYSFSAVATTLPIPAAGLAVTGSTATTVTLAWANPSVAPTIIVERSVDGGDTFAVAGSTGQGGTGFTDTGLTAGNTYVYRVRAFNGVGGYSDPSNTVSVVPA